MKYGWLCILLYPANLWAEVDLSILNDQGMWGRPLYLIGMLAAVSMLPFIGMMVTSFVKIAVVLSLSRQAIGTQQAPPSVVITGLAIILSVYVMYPVGAQIYDAMAPHMPSSQMALSKNNSAAAVIRGLEDGKKPLKAFLEEHASDKNIQMFTRISQRIGDKPEKHPVAENDLIVLVPAFVISELTKAFQIGFVIFLPFLVVDMVVANILMALGMQMLSPTTISLPFKILLFVMVDGWHLIAKGLITGYQ